MENIVLHIPHSSTVVPLFIYETYTNIPEVIREIQKTTDFATDEIFRFPHVDTVLFPYSRVVCDVERFPNDVEEPMAKFGMGYFYTHSDSGIEIRKDTPELRNDVMRMYELHHWKLEKKVEEKINLYNKCVIIDCHSFNDKPTKRDVSQEEYRPDICIGTDKFHTLPYLTDKLLRHLMNIGYSVGINKPYSGSIVPMKFYRKDVRVQSVMIEINKRLYMSNNDINWREVFNLNGNLESVFRKVFDDYNFI